MNAKRVLELAKLFDIEDTGHGKVVPRPKETIVTKVQPSLIQKEVSHKDVSTSLATSDSNKKTAPVLIETSRRTPLPTKKINKIEETPKAEFETKSSPTDDAISREKREVKNESENTKIYSMEEKRKIVESFFKGNMKVNPLMSRARSKPADPPAPKNTRTMPESVAPSTTLKNDKKLDEKVDEICKRMNRLYDIFEKAAENPLQLQMIGLYLQHPMLMSQVSARNQLEFGSRQYCVVPAVNKDFESTTSDTSSIDDSQRTVSEYEDYNSTIHREIERSKLLTMVESDWKPKLTAEIALDKSGKTGKSSPRVKMLVNLFEKADLKPEIPHSLRKRCKITEIR